MIELNSQGRRVLLATSLVSMVLGSVHAFSVFLEPLEVIFGTSRATLSLTYSFSLVFVTITVLFGPKFITVCKPQQSMYGLQSLGPSVLALPVLQTDWRWSGLSTA